MAVPKKRTSKAKKNARKANWKRKGYKAAQKSLSLAKSMLRGKTTSFVYSGQFMLTEMICFNSISHGL
jgi:large subunit ribosomal protein L32